MNRKIMIITGSPRKDGNTNTVAKWVAFGAREHDAEVEFVDAARLNYKTNGCTACMGCQESDDYRCIIKDEASEIIARVPDQDIVVFASPVFFFNFNAQTKLIMDRMYSLIKFRNGQIIHRLNNTEFALIGTAGGDIGSGLDILEATMKKITGFFGKIPKCLLVPNTPHELGEIAMNIELKEKAVAFGAELAK